MERILFIDIETNRKGKITDYGALLGIKELHEKHSSNLLNWIPEASIICGHNIIKHDIPELNKQHNADLFKGKEVVDTLLWSPLIFSENPYHHLVKGYKIVNESDVNNPLSDCKLTKELLIDEINGFHQLDQSIQDIYYNLLKNHSNFETFFSLLNRNFEVIDLTTSIKKTLKGKTCKSNNIEEYIENHPVELAYAISVMRLNSNESIIPSWVSHEYPYTNNILEELRFSSCEKDSCDYCREQLDLTTALHNYFGYPGFRKFDTSREISLQEETVRAGVQQQSFVAVFPTGGGKSITFQLPALMHGDNTGRLTVIISPLVSLMKDQVDNLNDKFRITKAVAINGLLSPLERMEAIERVEKGNAHLLYISPESLRSPTIYKLISSRTVARFVIDEAHCFSSWGQDFRVDYLYIGDFIKKVQEESVNRSIPVSCFTATAKPQVIEDIKNYFKENLDLRLKEFVTTKGRTNLSYEVIPVEDPGKKTAQLLALLHDCQKPAIVYASRTKRVEELAEAINKAGFNSTFFHGQLDTEVKKENMELFMSGVKDIIVATSAFGMGVDKDDVRTVIHFNISDSLENYIQEAGRAGRSENIQAKCYILFNEVDLNKHFNLLQQTKINKKEIEEIWRGLRSQAKNRDRISQSALQIAKKAGWDIEIKELETRVTTAISALEDKGFLRRVQNSPRVFADSLSVPSYDRGLERIRNSNNISIEDKKDCERVLKRIITDEEARLDYIAERTEMRIAQVQNAIRNLRDLNILGDAKDLSAFVNLTNSKNGSRQVLGYYLQQEKQLLDVLQHKRKHTISLRQLNQNVIDSGFQESTIEGILRILTYWEIRRFISKKRVDREKELYEIGIKSLEDLKEDIVWRSELSVGILDILIQLSKDDKNNRQKEDALASFSLIELKNKNSFLGTLVEEKTKRYELALLFLNQIKSIKLEGGFMVSYNRLNLEEIKSKEKVRYTYDDYEKLETYYQQRTEQIHIVGEYAKKSFEDDESASSYVNDYFTLGYEEFLAKHFPNRKAEIRRPLTKGKFEELIKKLDVDQRKVVEDNKSNHILVLAGPGSGKTKVLVHKIASLLLLEDIKPEQFLMLTFSKAASLEFKFRMRKLVPEFSGLVKITTFHGFCFELLGQLGDLEKSQNVITDCISLIDSGELDTTLIQNKSVLLLDEVQDINKDEWFLIQKIIEIASNIRVIAVGDDDQNIYSFRNSSNEYMNEFKTKFKATQYNLLKNYRSRPEIIEFNNNILKIISGRLKTKDLISAKNDKAAHLSFVDYGDKNHLIKPLAESVAKSELEGTRAVLVRNNQDAIMVSSLLQELGKRTRLLAGFEGFKLNLLEEVRWFTDKLKKNTGDSGLIAENDWEEMVDLFKDRFRFNKHLKACLDVFKKFDYAYPGSKLLVDWTTYIQEINMEDAVYTSANSILVSTMHKAKGREFDHVWILADKYDFTKNEERRLMYVACSRAKDSLEIHSNVEFIRKLITSKFETYFFKEDTYAPDHYELILNHQDVNLKSYMFSKKVCKQLQTGDELIKDFKNFGDNEAPGLAARDKRNVLLFSRKFLEKKLPPFEKDGYVVDSGNVEYIVYWYNQEEEKEYRIILPKVRFEKRLS